MVVVQMCEAAAVTISYRGILRSSLLDEQKMDLKKSQKQLFRAYLVLILVYLLWHKGLTRNKFFLMSIFSHELLWHPQWLIGRLACNMHKALQILDHILLFFEEQLKLTVKSMK